MRLSVRPAIFNVFNGVHAIIEPAMFVNSSVRYALLFWAPCVGPLHCSFGLHGSSQVVLASMLLPIAHKPKCLLQYSMLSFDWLVFEWFKHERKHVSKRSGPWVGRSVSLSPVNQSGCPCPTDRDREVVDVVFGLTKISLPTVYKSNCFLSRRLRFIVQITFVAFQIHL